jgi:hypothetical protein
LQGAHTPSKNPTLVSRIQAYISCLPGSRFCEVELLIP